MVKQRLQARAVFLACPDEHLRETFYWDGTAPVPDGILHRFKERVTGSIHAHERLRTLELHGEVLDFAGSRIGIVGAVYDRGAAPPTPDEVRGWLHLFAEEVDGYIGGVVQERRKQRLMMAVSAALKHPVLEDGIYAALTELKSAIRYSAFLLAYLEEHDEAPGQRAVRIVADGNAEVRNLPSETLAKVLFKRPRARPTPALYRLLRSLGISTFVHEQLITGFRDETVLGEIIVSSEERAFSTFELDVVRLFRGLLRLRLIDFKRERRSLVRSFSPIHARRLLSHPNYAKRFLAPRQRTTAIMFADLDDFTGMSERELVRPDAVLKLVDRWSVGVRRIVHEYGGVLDKIIGDCALALFGPPFFADDHGSEAEAVRDYCARALETAIAVRDYTKTLKARGGRELRAGIGLNVAPLAVGMMEVGDTYTGYGRGMNEAARLQDLADGDQILVSEGFYRRVAERREWRFSNLRKKGVAGVKAPLPYRELIS